MRIASLCVLVCAMSPLIHAQETIRDQARDLPPDGGVAITMNPQHPSMDVSRLLPLSDVVIECAVTSAASRLTDDERRIETTYIVTINRVLMSRQTSSSHPTPTLSTVRVRHFGGDVNVDGRTVRARDGSLAPFEIGRRLLLFLREDVSRRGTYEIVDGPFGAFTVDSGRINSLAIDPRIHQLYDGLSVDALGSIVQRSWQSHSSRPSSK